MSSETEQDTIASEMESVQASRLLLEFVHDRDVACPKCGYNLRALTRAVCPECREELKLTVGLTKMHFEWFVVTLIPGVFSGICAFLLGIPMLLVPIVGQPPIPLGFLLLEAFGVMSGLVAVGLFLGRHSFLRIKRSRQVLWALLMWAIHLLAFVILMVAIFF